MVEWDRSDDTVCKKTDLSKPYDGFIKTFSNIQVSISHLQGVHVYYMALVSILMVLGESNSAGGHIALTFQVMQH